MLRHLSIPVPVLIQMQQEQHMRALQEQADLEALEAFLLLLASAGSAMASAGREE